MIIYTNQKSKKRKKLTAKQRELQSSWNELLDKWKPTKKLAPVKKEFDYKLKIPPGRETPQYPSLNSGHYDCFKPINGKVYTGDKMKGIGTLHKSNAVPIFTDEEAKDQARMRR
jgi:hypothetical protein